MESPVENHGDGTATVWIERDPINGNDKNSGKKGEGPVRTLKRAEELLAKLPRPHPDLELKSLHEAWKAGISQN